MVVAIELMLLAVLAGLFFYGRYIEKRNWNKGACSCGKGFWLSFDVASDGSIGYRCSDGCGRYIWISHLDVTRQKSSTAL